MKIRNKTIITAEISPDFFIEAEEAVDGNGNESYDFWLCRKDYGQKEFIFGVAKALPTLKDAVKNWEEYFTDPLMMYDYCNELLDPCEHIVEGTFSIEAN